MDHDFNNQVILITGGTGALGSKVSESFLNFSPKAVIITFRSENEMQQLRAKILDRENRERKENSQTLIEFMKVDITREDEIKTLISNILEKYGQIHVLANVVGGYSGGKSVIEVS